MPWPLVESLLKGLFLALLLFAALQRPDARGALLAGAGMVAGVAISLGVAAVAKLRGGTLPRGRWLPFFLFLLLESPRLVYAGVLLGLTAAVVAARNLAVDWRLLPVLAGGGVAVGVGLIALRRVHSRRYRAFVGVGIAIATAGAALLVLDNFPNLLADAERRSLGLYLLLGLPFFYLLTFAGEAEETEAEAAGWCAGLGVAVVLFQPTPNLPVLAVALPGAIYWVYSTRILPGVRVFKHALRGLSFARMGQLKPALALLRRASELDPNHRLARDILWDIHRDLEPAGVLADPELTALVDPKLCLDRAALLLGDRPTTAQLGEAQHLLDLVASQSTLYAAPVAYWRAVALTHAKRFDRAASELVKVLEPSADPGRADVLFPAWRLALVLHPELKRRAGVPQLQLADRRADAIAATERFLANDANDADAWELKRLLYDGLSEVEAAAAPADALDAAYIRQLGTALADDPSRRPRGLEYLRIAAARTPDDAPALWAEIARRTTGDERRTALEAAERAGDPGNAVTLTDASRHAYFAAVKQLADLDAAAGKLRQAAGHLTRYARYERSGIETCRQLADLLERAGDPLAALKATEQGLLFTANDADLTERRDRYHYSLDPATLASAPDDLKKAVNVAYCLSKARQILDGRELDHEMVVWADHLAAVVLALDADSIAARVLRGRAALLLGDRERGIQRLESVRTPKPERFPASGDQEAYHLACRLLGDLYLKELDDPAKAADCFAEYRTSNKSGADTLYKLGQAHERLGDVAQAAKWYKQVTAFGEHPLAPDARAALGRLVATA